MSNDLMTRMVEAGARAMWCAATGFDAEMWDNAPARVLDENIREYWREHARAAIPAVVKAAEWDGVVLAKLPYERDKGDRWSDYRAEDRGWNDCRDFMLARKVKV